MARRLALIIGNSIFRDQTLSSLRAPDADTGDLADILLDPEVGGFDDVKLLTNLSFSPVRSAISEFFANKHRDDLLLLYYSGHGILDDQGRLYLAVKDTNSKLLRDRAISASFITDEIDNCRSKRQVLILDCCHSGAFHRGTKGRLGARVGTADAFRGTGYGRIVLTASDATQYAWEGDQVIGDAQNSLFTHFLIQGLRTGAADLDGDGLITIDELYGYTYEAVLRETPRQKPGKWTFKEQGDIIIAHNLHEHFAQPSPAPLPDLEDDLKAELEQRLDKLYVRGLSAFHLKDWEKAASSFQEIVSFNPSYKDVSSKLAEAEQQVELERLREQVQSAISAEDWPMAIAALETWVAKEPDNQEIAQKLESVRIRKRVTDLYLEARHLHHAGQWSAVVEVIAKLKQLDPEHTDPERLLSNAEKQIAEIARRQELERIYRQALSAMEQQQWLEAQRLLQKLQKLEPGFEETAGLLARAEEEIAAQNRLIELKNLYKRALQAVDVREWEEARDLLQRIEDKEPGFEDTVGLLSRVGAEIAAKAVEPPVFKSRTSSGHRGAIPTASALPASSKPILDKIKSSPTWLKIISALVAMAVLVRLALILFQPSRPVQPPIEEESVFTQLTESPIPSSTPQSLSQPGVGSEGNCSSPDVLCVALVTDGWGGTEDKSFNQSAWEGIQLAEQELGARIDFIETIDAADYAANIDQFAEQNFDVIVTVGFTMSDVTSEAADRYSNIFFIGADQLHFLDHDKPNMVGLAFPEDRMGFLAGALAAMISKSDTIAAVLGTNLIPPMVAFKEGYEAGARFINPNIIVIPTYHPGGPDVAFTDQDWGVSITKQLLNEGVDVVFAAAGVTGNAALIETANHPGKYCIGADTDQWETVPEAHRCLISSTMRLITPGVFNLIKMAHDGNFPSGNYIGDVGLAPFHDFDNQVSQEVKDRLNEIYLGLLDGSISTGYN